MLERRGALAELGIGDIIPSNAHGGAETGAELCLRELRPAAALVIVGWDETVFDRVRGAMDALGLPDGDPPGPREASSDARSLAVWLGRRRWLTITEDEACGARLCAAVEPECRIDWHCARSWMRLSGAAAESLLSREVPVDIRRPAFCDGAATQTVLGEVDVLMHARAREPEPVFDLLAGRSFAAHLARDLAHAAALEGLDLRLEVAGAPGPVTEQEFVPADRRDGQKRVMTRNKGGSP